MLVKIHRLNLSKILLMVVLSLSFSTFATSTIAQNRDAVSNKGSETPTILEVPDEEVVSVIAWNESGDMLAAASAETIYVWSLDDASPYLVLETDGTIGKALQWTDRANLHFSIQKNDETVFSVWNITTNEVEIVSSIDDLADAMAWNLSSGLVAGISESRRGIWDASTGDNLDADVEPFFPTNVVDVSWSPVGDFLVWRFLPERSLAGNLVVDHFDGTELIPVNIDTGFGSPECSSVAWDQDGQILAMWSK